MVRKLAIAIAFLVVVFGVAFWILTIAKSVSPGELGPHTADLENGKILFHAGGCASGHTILRGGSLRRPEPQRTEPQRTEARRAQAVALFLIF